MYCYNTLIYQEYIHSKQVYIFEALNECKTKQEMTLLLSSIPLALQLSVAITPSINKLSIKLVFFKPTLLVKCHQNNITH